MSRALFRPVQGRVCLNREVDPDSGFDLPADRGVSVGKALDSHLCILDPRGASWKMREPSSIYGGLRQPSTVPQAR